MRWGKILLCAGWCYVQIVVGVVTVVGESHRGDGCRRAVGSRREKNGRPIFVDSDGLHELVEAVPMGVPVGGGLVKNPSDRYAIRTRNLQDWNLTRYRCANRSNASGGVRTHASEEIGA